MSTMQTAQKRFVVIIDYWPEGREPTTEDVFLAVQDAIGPEGRLSGVDIYSVDAAGERCES